MNACWGLGWGSRVLSLKKEGYVCGGPESTLSQTSPLIRKQKAFLWRRLAEQGALWGRLPYAD